MSQHLQKPPDLDRGSRPSQEMREESHYVREEELRRLRQSFVGGCGAGRVVIEGSSASLAQTTVALAHGMMQLGPGYPGIPVALPTTLRVVAASFMGDSVPPESPWVATLWQRVSTSPKFVDVATFDVQTS